MVCKHASKGLLQEPHVAAETRCHTQTQKQQGTSELAAYLSLRLGDKHWFEQLLTIAFILAVGLVFCFILEEQFCGQ